MDYLYRPVSYTPSRTVVGRDGRIRLILCHGDPGYHNWLDTQGFEQGNLTYRNLMSDTATDIRTRLVERAELGRVLPPDTALISQEERVRQMLERFHAIQRRYGS
jgi:thiamine kinase-like enzyme